jgi:hypothetical protein
MKRINEVIKASEQVAEDLVSLADSIEGHCPQHIVKPLEERFNDSLKKLDNVGSQYAVYLVEAYQKMYESIKK